MREVDKHNPLLVGMSDTAEKIILDKLSELDARVETLGTWLSPFAAFRTSIEARVEPLEDVARGSADIYDDTVTLFERHAGRLDAIESHLGLDTGESDKVGE